MISVFVAVWGATVPMVSAKETAAPKWLVIEFPDGVRSHKGRIRGEAPRNVPSSSRDFPHIFTANKCGAVDPMVNGNVTHRVFIVSWSTKNDWSVVQCLKKKLYKDFNAGVIVAGPYSLMNYDSTPFKDLEVATDRPENKAQ